MAALQASAAGLVPFSQEVQRKTQLGLQGAQHSQPAFKAIAASLVVWSGGSGQGLFTPHPGHGDQKCQGAEEAAWLFRA